MSRMLNVARLFVVAATVAIASQSYAVTQIFFSEIGTVNSGSLAVSNPQLALGANSLYVWIIPDGQQILGGVYLNAVSSNPAAVNFTGVQVYNPDILFAAFGNADSGQDRWQSVGNGTNNGSSVSGFTGVSVTTGTGINPANNGTGPAVGNPIDALRDGALGAFLFAKLDFTASEATDLFLQIGAQGIGPKGTGTSADVNVTFGAADVSVLNGLEQRGVSSAVADATVAIPEPSAFILGGLGLVGMATVFTRRRKLS